MKTLSKNPVSPVRVVLVEANITTESSWREEELVPILDYDPNRDQAVLVNQGNVDAWIGTDPEMSTGLQVTDNGGILLRRSGGSMTLGGENALPATGPYYARTYSGSTLIGIMEKVKR